MKKRFVTLLLCGILAGLIGCERQDIYSEEKANELIDKAEETVKESESIDGFEKADYERFNSYASENGLGDTPIYIAGKVINQTELEDGKSINAQLSQIVCIVEDNDGNRWSVSYYSNGEPLDIEDKNVRIFGTYLGFSDVFNLPSMGVAVDGEENYSKARIETEEGGVYTEVWNFYDNYIKLELESSNSISDDSQEVNQKNYDTTTGQSNALASALLYLETMPFSYTGLIEQLEYEGYSLEDATYAADNCGADWNEQAMKSAKNYLDIMPFSKDQLIEQLEYEGYTHEQAVYGVEQNGY